MNDQQWEATYERFMGLIAGRRADLSYDHDAQVWVAVSGRERSIFRTWPEGITAVLVTQSAVWEPIGWKRVEFTSNGVHVSGQWQFLWRCRGCSMLAQCPLAERDEGHFHDQSLVDDGWRPQEWDDDPMAHLPPDER